MKTIDVHTKEWWDKVNGNTYFASLVTIDFGLPTEKQIKIPFQYGYGSMHEQEACKAINKEYKTNYTHLWHVKNDGIILSVWVKDKCKKSELKSI